MLNMNFGQWLRLAIQIAILALTTANQSQIGDVKGKLQALNSRAVEIPAESPPETGVKK